MHMSLPQKHDPESTVLIHTAPGDFSAASQTHPHSYPACKSVQTSISGSPTRLRSSHLHSCAPPLPTPQEQFWSVHLVLPAHSCIERHPEGR